MHQSSIVEERHGRTIASEGTNEIWFSHSSCSKQDNNVAHPSHAVPRLHKRPTATVANTAYLIRASTSHGLRQHGTSRLLRAEYSMVTLLLKPCRNS